MLGGIRVIIGILGVAAAASAAAADPSKVLRVSFPTQETGFDPAQLSDLYSKLLFRMSSQLPPKLWEAAQMS